MVSLLKQIPLASILFCSHRHLCDGPRGVDTRWEDTPGGKTLVGVTAMIDSNSTVTASFGHGKLGIHAPRE